MRAPTHSLGGAAFYLAACWAVQGIGVPVTSAAVAGGALVAFAAAPLPDIDNLGAWSRRQRRRLGLERDRRGRWQFRLQVVRWRRHPIKSRVAWLVTRLGTHRRGPCHSLLGGVIAAAAATWPVALAATWPLWAGPAVLAGWWSHLFLDLANEEPLMLFWPSPRLVHGLPPPLRCRVGGAGEVVWRGAVAFLLGAAGAHAIRLGVHGG